jgi:hypothetical protein
MHTLIVGFGLICASLCALFLVQDVIKEKTEAPWLRIVKLGFAVFFISFS